MYTYYYNLCHIEHLVLLFGCFSISEYKRSTLYGESLSEEVNQWRALCRLMRQPLLIPRFFYRIVVQTLSYLILPYRRLLYDHLHRLPDSSQVCNQHISSVIKCHISICFIKIRHLILNYMHVKLDNVLAGLSCRWCGWRITSQSFD